MKKKLAVATTAVLAMTMCLSMTACKDKASVSDLIPKIKGSYSTTVTTITNFSADANYRQTTGYADSNGVVVLAKTAKNVTDPTAVITYYSLYNVATNTTIVDNVAEPIVRLNDTLYYAQNAVDNTYTLYDSASGAAYASAIEGTLGNGVFTRKNGARIYVAPNGTVKEETNPFAKIVSPYASEVGDYYLDGDLEEGIFDVYNEKGDLKHSVNLMIELNISEDAELDADWAIGNKLFFQTVRVLPETEEEYDFYVEGDKIDLDTYTYDLKKGSGKELKNFDYYVNYAYAMNDSTAVASVQKINDGALSQEYMQSFNASGKVAVDLQKLVPGATDFYFVSEDKIALFDASGYAYIYKGSKRVATIPAEYDVAGNYVYDYDYSHQTLNIYDFKGNAVLNQENVVERSSTYDGNLIYSVKPEPTDATPVTYKSLYLFDVEKGTSTLIGTDSDTVSYDNGGLGYTVATVSGETTTYKTYSYGTSTVIDGMLDEPVAYSQDYETGKMYAVFATEANGVTTYYSIVVTTPYEK